MSKKNLDKQGDGGGKTAQCPICGAENAKGAAECTECSFTFEVEQPADSIMCTECGAELPAGTDSCFICGAEIKPVASTPAETGSDDWDLGVVGGDSIPAEEISEEPEPAVAETEMPQAIGENQFPCPSCGKPVDAGTSKCKNCWTDLPDMFSCPKCQSIIAKDSTSCPECYAKLKNGILMEDKPKSAPVVVEAEEPLEELMPMEETEEVVEETTEVFESPQVFGIECPFCQAITNPSEDICPECGMPLIEEEKEDKQPTITRKKEEPDWYRMIAIGVVVVLLISGILPFALPLPHVDRMQIRIDGAFSDWELVTGQNDTTIAELPASVDIVNYKLLTDSFNLYAFYELRGTAFGDISGDTARVFLDIDQNRDTGYSIMGIGADYQIRVFGHNGVVDSSSCLKFDDSRPSNDFNGFETSSPSVPHTAQSAQDANKFEVRVSLDDLGITPTQPVTAVFYMADSEGNWDHSDTPLASQGSVLMVKQSSLVPISGLLQGTSAQALSLELRVIGRPVTIAGITVPDCAVPQYESSMVSDSIQFINLTTNAATPVAGALIHREAAASNFDVENTQVAIIGQGAYAYARSAPATIAIDGAFADWVGKGLQLDDAPDDQKAKNVIDSIDDPGLDMLSQTTQLENNRLNILVETAGDIFAGMWVPELEESYVATTPTQTRTSDEQDHTYTEPPVTSTRQTTTIQRPTEKPEKTGEGKIRVFIDSGAGNAGYLINGINADYLVEVMGQDGKVTRSLMYRYDGTDQNLESWMEITTNARGASSGSRVELGIPITAFTEVSNNASAVIQLVDWNMNGDVADITAWDVFQSGDRFGTRGQNLPETQFLPGTVRGSVKDGSGNIIEGVTVLLRDPSNRFTTDVTNMLEYNYMIAQEISPGQTVTLYSNDGLNYGTGTAIMPSGTETNHCNLSLATPLPGTAPVNLEAKMSGTGVRLTWETGTAPDSFNIFRTDRTTSYSGNTGMGRYYGVKMATIYDGTISEYMDSTVAQDVTYYYFIESVQGTDRHYSQEASILADYDAVPQIQHDTFTEYYASKVPVKAIMTDDSGITSATVHYRKVGETAWTTAGMSLVTGNEISGEWEALMDVDADIETVTYQYYISAEDGTNVGLFGGPGGPGFPIPLEFDASIPHDPYPMYGFVKWADGTPVGSNVPVSIDWTDINGVYVQGNTITDSSSQYTFDLMNYDQNTHVWGNATAGGIWGYNETGNGTTFAFDQWPLLPTDGGRLFNITLNTPTISINKSAPATAGQGATITYTVTVTNTGNSTAYNINVTEAYSPWADFISSVPPPTYGENVWIIPVLNATETYVISIDVQILPATPLNTTVINNVTATWTNYTGVNWGTVNATASTLVTGGAPLLVLAKTAPATVNPGGTMTYTIRYWNNGTIPATNVWINETYPVGVNFVSATPVPSNPGVGDNVWYFASIAVGASGWINITVLVDPAILAGTTLFNQVLGQYDVMPDVQANATTLVVDPAMGVWKTGPATANAGQQITYRITYWNNGTDWAHNVIITETYPAGVTYVSHIGSGVFIAPGTWNIGSVGPGGSNSIDVTVLIDPAVAIGTVLTNRADLSYSNNFVPRPTETAFWNTTIVGPTLIFTKSAPATANAGQIIMYTLTVTNLGNEEARNVWIEETYPAGVTYFNSTLPTIGNNRWLIGTLLSAESRTIFINVTVNAGFTGVLINVAILDHTDDNSIAQPRQWANATTVVDNPFIVVDKTGPATANHGETIMYTIIVQNTGTDIAYNVDLTESYPANMLFVNANPPASVGNNVWNLGNLNPGETRTIFINLTVQAAAVSPLVNQVSIAYRDFAAQNLGPATDSWTTLIIDPIVSITKTAPANANSDQDITYTISYQNTGTDWAYNVTITESYPAGVAFVSATPAPSSGNNVWNIGDLAPGAFGTITITVHVNASVASGTTLTNWVYLDHNNTAGIVQPTLSDSAATLINNPFMVFTKTAPATANPGEVITYTLSYQNTGSATALGVVVEETYPVGVTFVSANPVPTIPNFRWTLGDIPAGVSGVITITVQIDAAFTGTLVNHAWLNYSNQAGDDYSLYDSAEVTVTQPIMTVSKTAPLNANPGEIIMYTIFYENIGSEAAYNVTITETYPANVTFLNANPAPTSGNNVWVINNVSAGANGTIFINVTISAIAEGILWNQVTLDYEDMENNSMPQEAADAVTILTGPYVTIDKLAPAEANAGETFVYTLAITNWGTDVAENLVITETYPGWITILSSNPAADIGNNIWNIPTLAAGATTWINITVRVSNFAPLGTVLTNSATVDYENGAGTAMPQMSDSAATTIVGPIVLMDKVAPATANTGQTITYTINWQVFGTDTAYNVYINETYPAGVTYQSAIPAPTSGNNVWALGNLAPGSSGTITITVLVTAASGVLTNTAVLEHSNGFIQMPDITDSALTTVINPIMQITKNAPAEAAPGQIITYTINYQNVGTDWAYDVVITETYPAGVTFVSAIPAPTSGNNVWNLGSIANGASGTITITVQVNSGATGTLLNSVTLAYNNSAMVMTPVSDTATTDIIDCVVTLSKQGPAQANTGETFTYWLNYTNIGTAAAYNVVITEVYPAGITFLGAIPAPTSGNNVWFIGDIAAGFSGSIQITVYVQPGAASPLHNFANVTGENAGGVPIPVTEATLDTVIIDPLLTIDKAGPATAVPGQQITYTITIQNTGTSPALDVWVTETYPAGFTFVSSSEPTWNPGTGDNIWHFASIPASGSVSFTITVQIPANANGSYTNSVVADYENGFRDMAQVSDSLVTTVSGPYVAIDKTGPTQANNGQTITYTLSVTNTGGATAFNVWVNDTYPAGVNFISSSIPATVGNNAWLVNDPLGTLAPGASWSVNIVVQITSDSVITNNATVQYTDVANTQVFTNTDSLTTQIYGPQLTIAKAGPAQANTGETFTYTITVTNNGQDSAANVVVTETYPAGVTYQSSTCFYPGAALVGTNVWNIPLIPIGDTVTITITVRVNDDATGILHNVATVAYTNGVGTPWPPETATFDTQVIDPSASLTKWAPSFANTGQLITYYLNYTISGTDSAYNVWINDTLPAGVTFVSSSIPFSYNLGQVYGWNLGNIPYGPTVYSIAITIQITAASGTLVNNALLEFQNGWRQMPDVTAQASTIIINPFLTLDKAAPATAVAGQTITYTITVSNTGDDFANNVVVTETYPAGVSFVSAVPAPNSGDNVWNLGVIAQGGSVVIQITVAIGAGVTWDLVNNVAATWQNAAGATMTPLTDQATTEILAPDMAITKTGPASATYWQQITYTITYINNGDAPAYNVWINDLLPPGVTLVSASTSWFIGTVNPGASGSVTVTVRVEPTAPASITNWVYLEYSNGYIAMPAESASWTTTILYPLMTLDKTAPATANTGEEITYVLTYTNTGTAVAANITVTEVYHPGIIFVSAVPAPTSGNNVWAIPNVAPGASGTITITVRVIALSGWINNSAVLAYTTLYGNPMPNDGAFAPTQVINPLMTMTKTAPSSAHRGNTIPYTLTYANTGNDVAYNVTITETYPAGVTYFNAIPAPTIGNNVWNIGSIAPGASASITIWVTVNMNATISLVNFASLSYRNDAEIQQPAVNATAITAIGDPMITIDKTGPATASVGTDIVYSIYYYNAGDGVATDVTIIEAYDPFVSFVSAVPAPTSGNNVWYVGNLTPGQGGWINVTVQVQPNATVIVNWAHLDYDNAAGTPQPRVSDYHQTGITGPFLTVGKTAPAMANTGQEIQYTITITNHGDGPAQDVWINETYPAGVAFFNANPAPISSSNNSTWYFASIAAGATVTIFINVSVWTSAVGTLVNTVVVNYENTEGVAWPQVSDTAMTLVMDPYVTISKTGSATVNPAGQITYTITVRNLGPVWAYNVTVTETYSAMVTFFSAIPAPTTGNNVWNIGMLAPNGTYVISITVNVSASASGSIVNVVRADYWTAANQIKPASFAWWNTTIVNPLLTIDKTAPATANPGQDIQYTILVHNAGTDWAENIIVTEHYPAGVTFVSATISPDFPDNTWFLLPLAPGASWSVTITVHISLLATGTLVNNATAVYENQVGTAMPMVWDTASTQIVAPRLTIDKAAPATANPGETITYTITVTNTGTDPALNVVVEEIYPTGVTFVSAVPAPRAFTTNFWDVGTLASAASWSVTITVQVNIDATGSLINLANATYENAAGMAMTPVQDTAVTSVVVPQMQFEKVAPVTANTGETITYTLRYRNVGTDVAYDVTIIESYPADITFLSSVPAPVVPTTNQWWFATVPNDGVWYEIVITVRVSTTASGTLLNSVTLDYESYVGISQPQLVATAQTLIADPFITMTKTAPQYANSGQTITYSISYRNDGTAGAYNVWINESYPAGVTYQSAIPAPTVSNNAWNIGYLAPGASGVINITVMVNTDAVGTLVNTATCEYRDRVSEPQTPVIVTATTTVRDPYLTVDKTAPGQANSGQQIIYTVTVENLGAADAYNVLVVESYPAGVTFVSYSSTGGPTQISDFVWLYSMIPAGGIVILTITVQIDANVPDGTILTNRVDVSYEDANAEQQTPIMDTASTTIRDSILTITKTGSAYSVAGGTITYTITVQNTGTGWAYNVVVKDNYPAGVTYLLSTPNPAFGSTWEFPQIAPGGSETISITVQVDLAVLPGILTNWAFANYTDLAGQQQPIISDDWQTAIQTPLMSIAKTASVTQANPGQTFTYTLAYQNIGSDVAQNVWLYDSLPAGVTYVGASLPFDYNAGQVYGWNLGNLAASASGTITITVTVNAVFLGVLSNTATIYYNNTAAVPQQPVQSSVNVNVINPLMVIDKSGPATSTVGATVMYVIRYENTGTDVAQNVQIIETYPVGILFVNANPPASIGNNIWNIGNVAPGTVGYIFINITFQANIATHRINTVTLDYINPAGFIQPTVLDTVDTLVPVAGTPLLEVTKTAPPTASISEIIFYIITVRNIGTAAANNVVITETYPADVTFVNANPGASVGNNIWNVPSIASGATYTIFVNVTVNAGAVGTLVNNVDVTYTGQPAEHADASTVIIGPSMSIYKSAPAMFGVSGNMQYTITYENTGNDIARNVVITETYPVGVAFGSAIPAPTSGNNVWIIDAVPPGGFGTITINVVVAASAGDVLVNQVTLDYETVGGYTMPQESASATTIITEVIMEISKTAPLAANPGETIQYVISINNPSGSDATDVLVTEFFPAGTSVVGLPIYGAIAPDSWTATTWFFNTIGAGLGTTITIFVQIDPTATGTLENRAMLNYTDTLSNVFFLNATARTTVTGPLLQIVKNAPATASPSTYLLYTITIENIGPGIAANVVVTETYPTQVSFVSSTPAPSSGNNVWNLGSINPGQTRTIAITVLASSSAFGIAVNRVSAAYTALNGTALPPVQTTASTLFAGPSMTIDKNGPDAVSVGQTFSYTITYRNIGSGQASNVRVQDVYPAGLTLDSASMMWSNHDLANRRITWNLGIVPAGSSGTITVTFQATGVSINDYLTNHAYLNCTNGAGTPLPTAYDYFVTRVTDAVMTLSKAAPATANTGEYIEYTISYFNNGNDYAINVVITETYPAGITYDSALPAPTFGNNVWNIPSVAPNTGGTITIRVMINTNVPSMTPLLNQVTLEYENSAGTPRLQLQDDATTMVRDPLLSIVKWATATSVSNGTVTYTITVTNTGDADAMNVVVTENYPSQVSFISASIAPSFGNNVWLAGTLAPSASWSVTITVFVYVYVQGNITNIVYVDYEDAAGESQAQESDSASTFIADPLLAITKTAPSETSVGGTITYIITVSNIGLGNAYNVVVFENYPAGTTFLNSSETPSTLSNDTWILPVVPAGWSGTLFINVTVDFGAVGTLVNTVLVDYDDIAGHSKPQERAEAATRIVAPYLTVTKDAPNFAYHGGLIIYTITVENRGTGNATAISVADIYPAGLTYVDSSIAPSFGDNVWNFTDLAPGQSIIFTVSLRVADYDPASILTGVTNIVFVAYQNLGGIAYPLVNDTAFTEIIAPLLSIQKSAPAVINTDETMTYTISYSNIGNGWTSAATLTETYPTGVVFVTSSPLPSTGNNVWELVTLAPGSSGTIEITVRITALPGTTLINTVELVYSNLVGHEFPVISAQATTLVSGDISVLPPRVTSTPPAFIWAGQNFTLYADAMGFGAGIDTVILYFTDIFGNTWSSVMLPLLVTTNGSGMYEIALPAQPYKGFVSYFVWVNDTNGNENRTGIFDVPVRLPPYFVWGNVYSHRNLPVGGAMVLITDVQTNETVIAYTDGTGAYRVDLATLYSGYMDGENLTVFATDGTFYGRNESFIDLELFSDTSMAHPNRRVNVVMNEIPEFTTILIPVLGMLVLVAFLGRRRRKKGDAKAI